MIYAILPVDPTSAAVRRDLTDVYALHRRVMSLFPERLPHGERVLFCADDDALIVQSLVACPQFRALPDGYLLPPGGQDIYLAPTYVAGQMLPFRLVANPTRRAGDRGPRVAVEGEGEQLAWLARKGEATGFRISEARAVDLGIAVGYRPEPIAVRPIRLRRIRFDGYLTITDGAALAAAVRGGIGSGNGFGCGLLLLRNPVT